MTTPDARLARVEERLAGLRDDVSELVAESHRARTRLHDLEGIAATLVSQERQRNRDTKTHQRRMELRLQLLMALVALVSVVEPLVFHVATGK